MIRNFPPFTRRAVLLITIIAMTLLGAVVSAEDGSSLTAPTGIDPVAGTGIGSSLAPPVAGFTVDRVVGIAPFSVQFTDASTGNPTSWSWDFGDGNTTGRQHPAHTYQQPGNYSVTLTVKNPGGSSRYTLITPISVREKVIVPDPDFTSNTSSGRLPLAVQFTDTSGGAPVSWSWDFDSDGIIDSTDQNPVCVYNRTGNYSVNLTITNAFRTKTIIRADIIHVLSRVPIVMYAANTTTGAPPFAVQFTDKSEQINITGWAWDFDNDGTTDSTDQNPSCVYNKPGNYTVNFTVTNPYGANTTAGSGFVTVTTGMFADFSANISDGSLPLAVQFMDNSTGTGITGWAWDFDNDSVIDSREKNPVCVYNKAGDYTVLHSVFNAFGSDTVAGPGYVVVTTGMAPDFSANVTNGTLPLAVQFMDNSTGTGITGWAWDFDNDSVIDSREKNPVCMYTRAGNYTVNLSVTGERGTNSTLRQGCIHVNTLAPVVEFTANVSGGTPPLAVQFADISTGDHISGWSWDFDNDGTIDSTEKNATCVYTRIGNYTVNLTVSNEYGLNTSSETDYIILTSGEPRARFAVNRTSGVVPLVVQFKDLSIGTNITEWSWDFDNDGIMDSREKNPSCVYNLPGNYSITFTVTNAFGSDTIVRKGFVTVDG